MTLLKGYNLSGYFRLSLVLIIFLLATNSVKAQGNLQIMPKRVVFETGKRFQELNLSNIGHDSAKYVISFINYRMKENGEFEEITSPEEGQNFADKYLRIFPRTITLGPNEAQSIKLQTIRTSDLPAGEYRSYLYFRAVPNLTPLGDTKSKADTAKNISIKLIPLFGLSIPAIIRVGETNSNISISDISLDSTNSAPKLKITFNRTGNSSVYGHLFIKYIAPDGTERQVGVAKGLAIYTPNKKRYFTLELEQNKEIDYHKGKLKIIFSTPDEEKQVTIAESALALK
ncbi:MAG TPA: hypothetical protein VF602_02280 [Pedobacter sp.]|jgi:hypothetical protein